MFDQMKNIYILTAKYVFTLYKYVPTPPSGIAKVINRVGQFFLKGVRRSLKRGRGTLSE